LASLPQRKRGSPFETWLESELHARFSGRILPIDIAAADRWGLLTANAKANPISAIDALLAATAIQHDLTLVSRNVGDFAHVPVQVLNPWEPS
jgi:predicted nucleic acid-binding protein